MSKELLLLRGLPGSGKSTFAEMMEYLFDVAGFSCIVACADDYFMHNGVYEFNARLLGNAHTECKEKVRVAMETGVDKIIVANTSTTSKEIKAYTGYALAYNYKLTSLIVENRHGNTNIHGVPDEALKRMEQRFVTKLI